MKYSCVLFLVSLFNSCNSQLLRSSLPVRYPTVGTYSQHFTNVFSFTKNQASLSQLKETSAGLYSEKRFLLRDLKTFSAVLSIPCFSGGAGVAADYTGFTGFTQSNIGIAYGRALGTKVDLGIQFNYHRTSIAGYGSASAVNFEMGTVFHLTDKIHAGCHVYNPFGGKFGKDNNEKLSSVYSFGLGYEASEKLYLGSEIIKEEDRPVDFNVVLHYVFVKQFFIRAGVSSSVGNYFAGAGFSWRNIRLDMAADWHPQGGLTPSLLLIFILSKSKSAME